MTPWLLGTLNIILPNQQHSCLLTSPALKHPCIVKDSVYDGEEHSAIF